MKKLKTFLIVIFLLILAGFNQKLLAQDYFLDTLSQRFSRHQTASLQEKVYVHLDQTFHLTGELLWFKMYVVDGVQHRPLELSKVGYIELLNAQNEPVLQQKVKLERGIGKSSAYLPVSLKSGNYTFRAYTSWMKNFSPDFFFEQTITIMNPLTRLKLTAEKEQQFNVGFYPEGGYLVQELESTIAFKVTNAKHKGANFKGAIVDQKGDTVLHFTPAKFGMGTFRFTPRKGETYQAIIRTEAGERRHRLPVAQPKGFVLQLEEKEESLVINVKAKQVSNPMAYLVIHTRQELKKAARILLVNNQKTVTLPKNLIGEGISHITLFNADGNPVCERLYFKKPSTIIASKVTLNQTSLETRQEVLATLTTDQVSTLPIHYSVAVFKRADVEAVPLPNIAAYLWLTSDLQGHVENPNYYFSEASDAHEAAQRLMLTHGWRRFAWEAILKDEPNKLTHPMEMEGTLLTVSLTTPDSLNPSSLKKIYVSFPSKPIRFYANAIRNDSLTRFVVNDVFGKKEVYVTISENGTPKLIAPYANQFSTKKAPHFLPPEKIEEVVRSRSIGMQTKNVFHAEETFQHDYPIVDSTMFYGTASKVYQLDDYTRFVTMEEVLREYVYKVSVRKEKDGYHFYALDENEDYFKQDPLILIDGLPVDANQFLAINPLLIKEIAVVNQWVYYANSAFEGILSAQSYETDADSWLEIPPNTHKFTWQGLQEKRKFFMSDYRVTNSSQERLPDFRHLLYWNSNLETNSEGKAPFNFFTSDQSGKFIGIYQGINPNGQMSFGTFNFEVEESN